MSVLGKVSEVVLEEEERIEGKIWSQSSGGRWGGFLSPVAVVGGVQQGDEGLREEEAGEVVVVPGGQSS